MVNLTTRFYLLAIVLVTVFFWYRSVQVREPWNVPTFMKITNWFEHKQHITAGTLAYVNNWLKEGPSALYWGQYFYPKSIEMPTLDKRRFHPSYPPMITLGLYTLFKTLEVTGIVPDIYHQRGLQILIVIWLNHIFHFLLALSMCLLVFVVTRKMGFDKLNSAIMAVVPSIVLFHNAGTLYWFNHLFITPIIIVPLFVMYILLELLRIDNLSPRTRKITQIGQPILMFVGVFTSWLFFFVVATVYIVRVIKKEINLPWEKGWRWAKQTFLFCWPSLLAISVWIYTIALYQQNVVSENYFDIQTSSMGLTATENFLHKLGITDYQGRLAGIEEKAFWFYQAFIEYTINDYGLVALLLIVGTLYLAIQIRRSFCDNIALLAYLLLLGPCIFYGAILTVDDAHHHFAALKYAPALSVAFILFPVFILQVRDKSLLTPALMLPNGKNITLVTVIAVVSSSLWAYSQIYSKEPVTRLFTRPEFHHLTVGKFIRDNTDYHDVVFSNDYYFPHGAFYIHNHFTIKSMHRADSLDTVFLKTKHIKEKFTIKIFHYKRSQREMVHLKRFLESQQLAASAIEKMPAGGLLSFDGKQFHSWYKKEYCKEFPDTPDLC